MSVFPTCPRSMCTAVVKSQPWQCIGFMFMRQEQGVWQQQPMIRDPWSSNPASPPPDPPFAGGADDVEQPHARRIRLRRTVHFMTKFLLTKSQGLSEGTIPR